MDAIGESPFVHEQALHVLANTPDLFDVVVMVARKVEELSR